MSRDIALLHPALRSVIPQILARCQDAGLSMLVTETWRTKAEQDTLYAKGRTAPGKIVTNVRYPDSAHCWGVAFDFCRNVRGQEYDDHDAFFERVARIAKPFGLSWGGDWRTFVDKPHLELTEFSSISTLKTLYKSPECFRASWARKEEENVERYKTLKDLPPRLEYAKPELLEMMALGSLAGDGNSDLMSRRIDLTEDMIRELIIGLRSTKALISASADDGK